MKLSARTIFTFAVASLAIAITAASADAKGCIKGAIVGGAAGHLAHHTFLGAAAGCVIGHHEAAKKEKELQAQPGNGMPSDAPPAAPKQ